MTSFELAMVDWVLVLTALGATGTVAAAAFAAVAAWANVRVANHMKEQWNADRRDAQARRQAERHAILTAQRQECERFAADLAPSPDSVLRGHVHLPTHLSVWQQHRTSITGYSHELAGTLSAVEQHLREMNDLVRSLSTGATGGWNRIANMATRQTLHALADETLEHLTTVDRLIGTLLSETHVVTEGSAD